MATEETRRKEWQTLRPYERAVAWKNTAPEIAERLLEESRRDMRHDRRMQWANWWLQLSTVVFGYLVSAITAWHFADLQQPWYGVGVFGAGTVTTTVGGYMAKRAGGRRETPRI